MSISDSRALRCLVAGLLLLSILLPTAACQNPGGSDVGPKTGVGAALGAAGGGLLGAALGGGALGIASGVLLGGLTGGVIGNKLDQNDREYAGQASAKALETLPSGQSATWRNPDSGNSGTVTPVRTYQTGSGSYCREYQQTVTIGGENHQSYGTACRQPDGTWKIAN